MKRFQKVALVAALTLSFSTVGFAGTITGSRTSRVGTITGSRAGTITGSRAGTITGSAATTEIGAQPVQGRDELFPTFIEFLISLAW